MSLGTKNVATLKKSKEDVKKLTSPPVNASDKAALLKLITDVIPVMEKTLPLAKQFKKDNDHLVSLSKQKGHEKEIQTYHSTKMKYRDPLGKSVKQIHDDMAKASEVAEKIQKDLEKQKQTKLANDLKKLATDLWSISTEHSSFAMWTVDVLE